MIVFRQIWTSLLKLWPIGQQKKKMEEPEDFYLKEKKNGQLLFSETGN